MADTGTEIDASTGAAPGSTDWATHFNHFDPSYNADPAPIWSDLRERCPVARGADVRGMWAPVRYDDVVAVAHDVEHFSSRAPVIAQYESTADFDIIAPPISSDPPYHTEIRRMLLPFFAPKPIAALQPKIEEYCDSLIDGFIASGRCDAAADYASHIPVRIIAEMLGVPLEDDDKFRNWVHIMLEVGLTNMEEGFFGLMEFLNYFREAMVARRAEPRDDIVSFLAHAEMEGRPLDDQEVLGVCLLLLLAGIDTTWSSIGSTLLHLATHPDDAQRLRDDPSLWPVALEEFLRVFSPVTMAREVVSDVEFAGCPMKAGDPLLLLFPAANRDPAAFPDPDTVDIERALNRHVAFGVGIHRCLGSNLARLELQIAVQRFIERVPSFRLADDAEVRWSVGQVRGPRALPFVLG